MRYFARTVLIILVMSGLFATTTTKSSSVEKTVTTSTTPNKKLWKYTITNNTNQTVKDVHLDSDTFDVGGTAIDPDGSGPWTASTASGAHHWVTSGSGLASGSSMEFVVEAPDTATEGVLNIILTNDGSATTPTDPNDRNNTASMRTAAPKA